MKRDSISRVPKTLKCLVSDVATLKTFIQSTDTKTATMSLSTIVEVTTSSKKAFTVSTTMQYNAIMKMQLDTYLHTLGSCTGEKYIMRTYYRSKMKI